MSRRTLRKNRVQTGAGVRSCITQLQIDELDDDIQNEIEEQIPPETEASVSVQESLDRPSSKSNHR